MTRQTNTHDFLKRFCLGLAMCLAVAATAQAARVYVHVFQVELPGVDHFGNLDFENTGSGRLKLLFNTRSGHFCATARGHVPNESHRSQHFKNQIVPTLAQLADGMEIDPEELHIRRDLYCVSRRGWAQAILVGRYTGSPSDMQPE